MMAKLTRNQKLVFNKLQETKRPLTAYALLDLLREQGFRAPLQVYRALNKLQELALVHRLETINAFVVCCHVHEAGCSTVAFTLCKSCGEVTEFANSNLTTSLSHDLEAAGFSPERTMIEVTGLCEPCSFISCQND